MLLVKYWVLFCVRLVVHFIKPDVPRTLIARRNRKTCINSVVTTAHEPFRNLQAPVKEPADNPADLSFTN